MAYLRPTIKLRKRADATTDPEISHFDSSELFAKYENEIAELKRENENLKQKYENLKAIKINSTNPVIFPHQKIVTRDSMLSQKFKYLEELRKKDELAIANLKDENAKLRDLLMRSIIEPEGEK